MKLIYGRRLATAVLQAQKLAVRPSRTTHNLFQKEKLVSIYTMKLGI